MVNNKISTSSPIMTKPNILIVDDAPLNLRILSKMLNENGYLVHTAECGEKALSEVASAKPDLILLDIIMPDMEGYEVCRRLKDNPNTDDIPIIFISALTDTEDIIKGFEVGGVDYITKPFKLAEVLVRVRTHVELNLLKSLLEQSNQILEQRVQERTESLQKINQELEKEIGERIQVENTLRESEERYTLAVNGSNDGLYDWDINKDKIYYSSRWKEMLGYQGDEIGDSVDEWFNRVHADDLARLRMSIVNHIENLSQHLEEEYRMQHKDGTYRYVLTKGLAVRDRNGKGYRLAGSQTDITYRKRIEEQLFHDAYHDPLTALPNRTVFIERINNALALANQRPDYGFALLTLDIDRFKAINDELGHEMGDMLLAEISWGLKSLIHPLDTLARIGEDEFGILLENVKETTEVEAFAKKVHQTMSQPINLGGKDVVVALRIGIAINETREKQKEEKFLGYVYQNTDELLRDAGFAMQQAKLPGETRYVIFMSSDRPKKKSPKT